jgi:hypothetical protein
MTFKNQLMFNSFYIPLSHNLDIPFGICLLKRQANIQVENNPSDKTDERTLASYLPSTTSPPSIAVPPYPPRFARPEMKVEPRHQVPFVFHSTLHGDHPTLQARSVHAVVASNFVLSPEGDTPPSRLAPRDEAPYPASGSPAHVFPHELAPEPALQRLGKLSQLTITDGHMQLNDPLNPRVLYT